MGHPVVTGRKLLAKKDIFISYTNSKVTKIIYLLKNI